MIPFVVGTGQRYNLQMHFSQIYVVVSPGHITTLKLTKCKDPMQVVLVVLLAYTIIQGIIQLFYYAYLNEFFNEKFYLWPSFYGLHLAWKRIVAAKKNNHLVSTPRFAQKKGNHFQNSDLSFVQLPDHYYWTIISYLKPIYHLEKYI